MVGRRTRARGPAASAVRRTGRLQCPRRRRGGRARRGGGGAAVPVRLPPSPGEEPDRGGPRRRGGAAVQAAVVRSPPSASPLPRLRNARWLASRPFGTACPTGLRLTDLELVQRLAALVPPPHANMLLYHGVFGPSAAWRDEVVPAGPEPEPSRGRLTKRCSKRRSERARRRWPWSDLLWHVFGVDGFRCPRCGGSMVVRAVIRPPAVEQSGDAAGPGRPGPRRCPCPTRGGPTGGAIAPHLAPDSSLLRAVLVRVERPDEQDSGCWRAFRPARRTREGRLRRARRPGHRRRYPAKVPIRGVVSIIPGRASCFSPIQRGRSTMSRVSWSQMVSCTFARPSTISRLR